MPIKILTLALGGLLALGATATAPAQDNAPPPPDQNQAGPPPQGPAGRGMRIDPDRQLAHLTHVLGLTSDQQAQIKPLLIERQQKIQTLMQDQSVTPEDRHAQMHSIVEGTNNSIKALLTEDQKQKFAAMQERMRHHMGGPGAGGPPPPPDSSAPQPQS
jgi:periplasmic protein CpxP/Spy